MIDQSEPPLEHQNRPSLHWTRAYYAPLVFVPRLPKLPDEALELVYPEPPETGAEEAASYFFSKVDGIHYESMEVTSTEIAVHFKILTRKERYVLRAHPLEFRFLDFYPFHFLSQQAQATFFTA